MGKLFDRVRASENLFQAWRHVKRSAANSSDSNIRGEASEFESQHQKHLRKIHEQLRSGRFLFDQSKGVLKDKKKRIALKKDPRPIVIGTIKNRVVQRAILQVLQPCEVIDPKSADTKLVLRYDARIGKVNHVNRSKFGVGGLIGEYGGVRPAIEFIMSAMKNGAGYYYRSDIKAFFTKIPVEKVIDFLRTETGDPEFVDLFRAALDVDLANKEEMDGYERLFPADGVGVAQGSSLSAFAGNVLLYEFDHTLNGMGVQAIRYIDDIIILSDDPQKLDSAIEFANKYLDKMQMSLYMPSPGSDKAAQGLCVDAFDFLGCTIQPNRCVPSEESKSRILHGIQQELKKSKAAINKLASEGGQFDIECSQSATLDRIGRRLYGWVMAVSFVSDAQAFRHVDKKVFEYVENYRGEVGRILKCCAPEIKMRAHGVPSVESIYCGIREKKKLRY